MCLYVVHLCSYILYIVFYVMLETKHIKIIPIYKKKKLCFRCIYSSQMIRSYLAHHIFIFNANFSSNILSPWTTTINPSYLQAEDSRLYLTDNYVVVIMRLHCYRLWFSKTYREPPPQKKDRGGLFFFAYVSSTTNIFSSKKKWIL